MIKLADSSSVYNLIFPDLEKKLSSFFFADKKGLNIAVQRPSRDRSDQCRTGVQIKMGPKMLVTLMLVFLVMICNCYELDDSVWGDETPKWPRTYTINGMIQIPYAEIEEPFTAYLTSTYGRSRVDFYGGT